MPMVRQLQFAQREQALPSAPEDRLARDVGTELQVAEAVTEAKQAVDLCCKRQREAW